MARELGNLDVGGVPQKFFDPGRDRGIAGSRAGDLGFCPGQGYKVEREFPYLHVIDEGVATLLGKALEGIIVARWNGLEMTKSAEMIQGPEYLGIEHRAVEVHHGLMVTHVAAAELDAVALLNLQVVHFLDHLGHLGLVLKTRG